MINKALHRGWLAPLAVAGVVALFGLWGNARLKSVIDTQVAASLRTTLEANVTALDIWTTNQMNLASSLIEEPRTHELATHLLQHYEASGTNIDSVAGSSEAREFETLLRPRVERLGYGIAHLVATNYTVIANVSRGRFRGRSGVNEEHLSKFAELFSSGRPVIITPFKPRRPALPPGDREGRRRDGFGTRSGPASGAESGGQRGRDPGGFNPGGPPPDRPGPPPTNGPGFGPPPGDGRRGGRGDFTLMQVAAPVVDSAQGVLGALALIINPDKEFTRILSVARSGDSGETYAFDPRGVMLSRSRFDAHLKMLGLIEDREGASSALNLRLSDPGVEHPTRVTPEDLTTGTRPLIHLVARALAGAESGIDLAGSRDYRGVRVVGAWKWVPQHGFGVVTQIDADEAYRPLRILQTLFVLLFLLLLLCATGMLVFSHANQIWRQRLSEAELKLQKLGQYSLEEKIGEGGMGTVFRARHALMRRETAVKLLLPNRADEEAVERFEREVCLTCQLTHPNTIQIYDYGHTPEGVFYYAMEYLEGLNLHDLVRRFGPQPEARVVHILVQVCDALAEAHRLGLVHRDIKPANIFLCDRGGLADHVKVLDFGLVREYGKAGKEQLNITDRQEMVGTPSFMPPEAFRGMGASDPRSDIYSIGALGYFLITGRNVFDAGSVMELFEKHLKETPVPPSRVAVTAVSAELDQVLLDCLAKDPSARPATVEALHASLARTPCSMAWTPDLRRAWWERYRNPGILNPGDPPPPTGGHDDVTIKIDLASRGG